MAGVAELTKAAQKLPLKLPSEITTKNGVKYVKILADYEKVVDSVKIQVNRVGCLCVEKKYGSTSYYVSTNQLAVPEAGRVYELSRLLANYNSSNPLTSSASAKSIKFSSATASAKKNTITLKFKKKITKAHIISAKYKEDVLKLDELKSSKLPDNQAYVRVAVYNKNKRYVGVAKIILGKKTATMQIFSTKDKNGKVTYKKQKIKKGQTYTLMESWTLRKKVKAK